MTQVKRVASEQCPSPSLTGESAVQNSFELLDFDEAGQFVRYARLDFAGHERQRVGCTCSATPAAGFAQIIAFQKPPHQASRERITGAYWIDDLDSRRPDSPNVAAIEGQRRLLSGRHHHTLGSLCM